MKTKLLSLVIGFVLGTVTLLLLGQSRPTPLPAANRYTMLFTGSAVLVQDSATGAVKMIPSTDLHRIDSEPNNPQLTMRLGAPFEIH